MPRRGEKSRGGVQNSDVSQVGKGTVKWYLTQLVIDNGVVAAKNLACRLLYGGINRYLPVGGRGGECYTEPQ